MPALMSASSRLACISLSFGAAIPAMPAPAAPLTSPTRPPTAVCISTRYVPPSSHCTFSASRAVRCCGSVSVFGLSLGALIYPSANVATAFGAKVLNICVICVCAATSFCTLSASKIFAIPASLSPVRTVVSPATPLMPACVVLAAPSLSLPKPTPLPVGASLPYAEKPVPRFTLTDSAW